VVDYEYQIISLPLGEGQVEQVMAMPRSIGEGSYQWHHQTGATAVLMHFARLGWEPATTLGIVDGVAHILLRKRVVTAGRGGPH
jgi:hypothetical protein